MSSKSLRALGALLLVSGLACGQYGGTEVLLEANPQLTVVETATGYQIDVSGAFPFAPVDLWVGTAKGAFSKDFGPWGWLTFDVWAPASMRLGFADPDGNVSFFLQKPSEFPDSWPAEIQVFSQATTLTYSVGGSSVPVYQFFAELSGVAEATFRPWLLLPNPRSRSEPVPRHRPGSSSVRCGGGGAGRSSRPSGSKGSDVGTPAAPPSRKYHLRTREAAFLWGRDGS